MNLCKLINVFMLAVVCFYVASASADCIKDCVEGKKSSKDVRDWSMEGEVTCQSTDIVGFPPRERRFNRDSTVVYESSNGYTIVNDVNAIKISVLSSLNGFHETPSISNGGKRVTVVIHCKGTGLGQGRAWHKISLAGKEQKDTTEDEIIKYTLECVKECAKQQ